MRKGLTLSVMSSAVFLAMTTSAMAATPDLAGWSPTVSNGTIGYTGSALCSGGFTCAETASGNGFVQLQVTETGTANTYIVTMVTDQNTSTPTFTDKSMVKVNFNNTGLTSTTQSGILAYQTITQDNRGTSGVGELFKSNTTINSSSFAPPTSGASKVTIDQAVIGVGAAGNNPETAPTAKDFVTGFWYESTNDAAGVTTGMKMEIDQFAGLQDKGGSANDIQAFTLREAKGTALAAQGKVTLPGATNSSVPANGTAPTYPANIDVAWTAGQDVKAIWIGQNVSLNSAGGPFGSTFGYLSFENVSDKSYATRASFEGFASNTAAVTPWNTAFNVRGQTVGPCLNSPAGAVPGATGGALTPVCQ